MKERLTALAVIMLLTMAACSPEPVNEASEQEEDGAAGGTLHVAFADNPTGGIDPAQFYNIEGEALILSVYEGLLAYAPDSNELVGSLAEEWEVNDDLTEYTFTLRDGVKFHDGTDLDSEAVRNSFQRSIDLGTGPSYMLGDVESMETPDPQTLVIRLKQPNNAFLDYMASMYGPKVISPQAIEENSQGDPLAKKWLRENAVGTGPFQLDTYAPNERFVLTRFDDYWGEAANFDTVEIAVIPDIGSQQLQLEAGDLDMILHGISPSQVDSLDASEDISVESFDSVIRQIILLNVHRPPLDDPAVREAFFAALDREAAVDAVYGDFAEVAESIYPKFTLPEGMAPIDYSGDATVPEGTEITITFPNVEPDLRRIAEFVQPQLEEAGFDVTLKADTYAQEFGYYRNLEEAPNAIVSTFNPDAAHPDTWGRLIWHSEGGLNLLGYSVPESDRLMDEGLRTLDEDEADSLYAAAGEAMSDERLIVMLADAQDLFAVRSDITGLEHVPAYIWTLNLAALERE